jgi:hypothetical protein
MIESVFAMIETNAGGSARLPEGTGPCATCNPIRHRMSILFPHPTAISILVGRVAGQKYQWKRGNLESMMRELVRGLQGMSLVSVEMYCGTSATPLMCSLNRMLLATQCQSWSSEHLG